MAPRSSEIPARERHLVQQPERGLERGAHLGANVIVRVVETPPAVGVLGVEPVGPDDHQ